MKRVNVMMMQEIVCREFLLGSYVDLKKANPQFPFLVREASNVEAKLIARYGKQLLHFAHAACFIVLSGWLSFSSHCVEVCSHEATCVHRFWTGKGSLCSRQGSRCNHRGTSETYQAR